MGSSQSFQNFDYSKLGSHGAKCPILTEDDMRLIRNSWDLVKKNPELGMSIMVRIFTEHKSIKHIWIFATKLETEAEMRSNSQLRYHAGKIISTFVKVIDDMDSNLSKNRDYMIELGSKHYDYGVKYEYFKDFHESLLYSLEAHIDNDEVFNKKTKEAWTKLMLIIADQLCTGIRKREEKQAETLNNNAI